MSVPFSCPGIQPQTVHFRNSANRLEIFATLSSSIDLCKCILSHQVLLILFLAVSGYPAASSDPRAQPWLESTGQNLSDQLQSLKGGPQSSTQLEIHYFVHWRAHSLFISSVQRHGEWRGKGEKSAQFQAPATFVHGLQSLYGKVFHNQTCFSLFTLLHPSHEEVEREIGVILKLHATIKTPSVCRKLSADKSILPCLVFSWLYCSWPRSLIYFTIYSAETCFGQQRVSQMSWVTRQ